MDDFSKHKNDFLNKADKSNKGSIDKDIKLLVGLINSLQDYYTTSSCSGRIGILMPDNKKNKTSWLFLSHDKISLEQIKTALERIPEQELWFMQEAVILHVCCRTIKSAQELMSIARDTGFKRGGIITASKKIVVELLSTESISTIISKDNRLLVSEDYLYELATEANRKLDKTREKIAVLYNRIKDKIELK